jgi:hypothetical protein
MSFRDQLPELLREILAPSVYLSVISAPTGSGKSVELPRALALGHGVIPSTNSPSSAPEIASITDSPRPPQVVWVALPTVPAVHNLVRYQKILNRERGEQLRVGWAAGGVVRYSAEDQLVYVTAGHLRRYILEKVISVNVERAKHDPTKEWAGLFCNVLVIDEAHTGSLDNSIIVNLWNFILTGGGYVDARGKMVGRGVVPRLCLLSASNISITEMHLEPAVLTNPKFFRSGGQTSSSSSATGEVRESSSSSVESSTSTNLNDNSITLQRNGPILTYTYTGATYPVEIHYQVPGKHLYQQIAATLQTKHDEYDVSEGSFLAFLPGKGEVAQVYNALDLPENAQVEIITGEVSPEELEVILHRPANPQVRLIILATNAVESSVTIPDLFLVVDSMQEKVLTEKNGTTYLLKQSISKDSAKQRAGRVGRTKPGVVYRMISENDYEGLAASRAPEIERVPIHNFVLELIEAQIDPMTFIRTMVRGEVTEKIQTTQELLFRYLLITNVGSLDQTVLRITKMGSFVNRFPLSIQLATCLGLIRSEVHHRYNLFYASVVIGLLALWDINVIKLPKQTYREAPTAYRQRVTETISQVTRRLEATAITKGTSKDNEDATIRDDLDLILFFYMSYWNSAHKHRVNGQPNWNIDRTWAKELGFHSHRVKKLFNMVSQVSRILKQIQSTTGEARPFPYTALNPELIRRDYLPIFKRIYTDQVMTRTPSGTYRASNPNSPLKGIYRLDQRSATSATAGSSILALNLISTRTATRSGQLPEGTISFFINLTP